MKTIEDKARDGESIAEILNLKKDAQGRYATAWGNKTAYGVYLLLEQLKIKFLDN